MSLQFSFYRPGRIACVIVDLDMNAHALWGGGFLLEFVHRLCMYLKSCAIQDIVCA